MANAVFISGRFTKDPEIRYTQGGLCWASFTIATDNPGKDKGASFIPCKAFDKTAEVIEKYGAKGRLVLIQGHIQTGSYVNKEGKKVYTTDVIVSKLEFMDKAQKTEPDETDKGAAVPEGFSQLDTDIPF